MLNEEIGSILFKIAKRYDLNLTYRHNSKNNSESYFISEIDVDKLWVETQEGYVCFLITSQSVFQTEPICDMIISNETKIKNVLESMRYYLSCENYKEFLEKLEIILREVEMK